MNTDRGKSRIACRLMLGVLPLVFVSLPLHADNRTVYERSYTLGQDALSPLDAFPAADLLRPGFRNDVQRGSELNLGVRSTRLPSASTPGLSEQSVETSGGFIHRFGSTGFGYGVDLGMGLYSSTWDQQVLPADEPLRGSGSLLLSDFSTGPTYESGNFRSRVRVGVRYPVLGDGDAGSSFYGHRGDVGRSAGYLSLDSRLRFSNQTEMSVSLFYDDYSASGSRDWLSEDLNFRGGAASPQSVVGFEMGLNF
jgi:hypothetical protein